MGIRPCGAKGIRTPDLLIANETRYQLRHSPLLRERIQLTTGVRGRKIGARSGSGRSLEDSGR